MQTAYKTINVRLSEPSYRALKQMADARGTSMNKAVEESIAAMAAIERKKTLRRAFERIAGSEHDPSFALDAQSEVVLAEE